MQLAVGFQSPKFACYRDGMHALGFPLPPFVTACKQSILRITDHQMKQIYCHH